MHIAEFLPTLHHLVKITCQLYGFPVCLVGADQDVNGSRFPISLYSSLDHSQSRDWMLSCFIVFPKRLQLDRATEIILF